MAIIAPNSHNTSPAGKKPIIRAKTAPKINVDEQLKAALDFVKFVAEADSTLDIEELRDRAEGILKGNDPDSFDAAILDAPPPEVSVDPYLPPLVVPTSVGCFVPIDSGVAEDSPNRFIVA